MEIGISEFRKTAIIEYLVNFSHDRFIAKQVKLNKEASPPHILNVSKNSNIHFSKIKHISATLFF